MCNDCLRSENLNFPRGFPAGGSPVGDRVGSSLTGKDCFNSVDVLEHRMNGFGDSSIHSSDWTVTYMFRSNNVSRTTWSPTENSDL